MGALGVPAVVEPEPAGRVRVGWWRPALLAAVLATGALVVAFGPPLDLPAVQSWVRSAGAAAPLLYVACYVAGALLLVPRSLLSLTGGLLFGVVAGTLLAVLGATLAALACFLLARAAGGRALAAGEDVEFPRSRRQNVTSWRKAPSPLPAQRREDVEIPRSIRQNVTFWRGCRLWRGRRLWRWCRWPVGLLARVDGLLSRRGWLGVACLRLVPVLPYSVVNYGCALTRLRLGQFALGTAVGCLPGTVLLVVTGAALV